jgi:hypothetical protein
MFAPFVYMPGILTLLISKIHPLPAMFHPVLHYILAAMGVFLFLRRKEAGFLPALLGGLAFMFTPYLVTMLVHGHGSQMMTAAYIPWALWASDRLIEKFSWRNLGLAGLILGFQLQRGHVQIAYYSLMLVGLYVFYHLIWVISRKEIKRIIPIAGGFLGAMVLAGALAAVIFLPLREYTPYSIRGTPSVLQSETDTKDTGVGFEYATNWSFSPGEMMTFLIPSFYGFGGQTYWGTMPFTDYPNYMGILVLALAVTALVIHLRSDGQRQLLVGFFGLVILVSLLISFGRHFALFYKLFYNYFPYFNKFRVPAMILILVQFSVAALAGLGLDAMIKRFSSGTGKVSSDETTSRARMAKRLWITLAVVAGVVVLLTLAQSSFFQFMRGLYPDEYEEGLQLQLDTIRFRMLLTDLWIVAVIVAGGLIMSALALSNKISANAAAAAICLFTVVDLWVVDKKIDETYPQQQLSAFLEPDEITRFLRADTSVFRIYPVGQLFGELRWSGQGFQSVGGYHAAKPRFYQDFNEATGLQTATGAQLPTHSVIDMINTKYLITFASLPDSEWVTRRQFKLGRQVLTIYENPTVLPRAYLVGEWEVESDPKNALKRLGSGGFDPHRRVLLSEAPECEPQPDSTARAQLLQSDYDLHHIKIKTQSASPQILVLSDNYYPVGWQAFVDHQPVKTYRANYCFRAVCVPAGSHTVEFRFHSSAFVTGLWTSLGALAVSIALLFIGRRERKTSSATE